MISKPVRLTTSLLRWGKVSWLCCAQVFVQVLLFDNLGFFLRENLLLYSSYLPLGVSQRACDPRTSNLFSGAVVGDLRHICSETSTPSTTSLFWCHTYFLAPHPSSCFKGSLTLPTFLLCLLSCLVYFYFVLFVFFIKNRKKLVACI